MFWRTSAQVSATPNRENAPKSLCFQDNDSYPVEKYTPTNPMEEKQHTC